MAAREQRWLMKWFLLLLTGLLLVACGGTEPTPVPSPITLRSSAGAEQSGTLGSYCWSGQTGKVCADGPLTIPVNPLAIVAGTSAQLDFRQQGTPTEANYTIYRYDATMWRQAGGTQDVQIAAVYPENPVRRGELSAPSIADILLDLSPGQYALVAFARYPGGDTTQGFYFAIE